MGEAMSLNAFALRFEIPKSAIDRVARTSGGHEPAQFLAVGAVFDWTPAGFYLCDDPL
jgi:hypothetical protein